MPGTFALSAPQSAPVASGGLRIVDGVPVQRFVKDVIRVGKFVKRDPNTKIVQFVLDVTPERMQTWVNTFKSMQDNGVKVKLMDETGAFTIDAPKSPLTKNHAGAFDRGSTRLRKIVENSLGDTVDMFIEGETLKVVQDVKGQEAIDLVRKIGEVSAEIDHCFIDGADKKHGEAITAISLVPKGLVPGQKEFVPIAASEESPADRVCLSFENSEDSMTPAILAAIALAAGLDTSKVTEANALDTLKGVHSRITSLEADKVNLTKQLSEESPTVDPNVLALSAELLDTQVESVFGGIVNDKGLKEIKALISTDAAGKPAGMILSSEAPMEVVSLFKSIAKIVKANPGLRKGSVTPLQGTVALSDEHAGQPEPLTPERVAELLNMTPTGREVVSVARSK